MNTVQLDHFGPLPAITSKKKHLLVVVDAFTKYVKLYPVNSTSPKEVICSLQKYFEYYSRPVRIISDRGSCFTSNEFNSFVDGCNIDHIKNATCAPQANGQVEKVNRIIKNMLGKLSQHIDNADWTKRLKDVEFAINNAKHSTTGLTLCELLFGVQQRSPVVDYLTEHLQNVNVVVPDVKSLRDLAEQNIRKSQEYCNKRHEEHSKGAKVYGEGDLLFIHNVDTTIGTNKKLVNKFKGPYTIDKVLPNDRYVVKDIDGCQVSQIPYEGVIEARHIRLWRNGTKPS